MELVFCWHIDADGDIERALMYDKAEQAARISQGVDAGHRILESWVLRSHGRMLDEQGVMGSAQLSAEYLEELSDIVRQVEEATSARMHVGVGAEPSEAVIARKIAEDRGGDPAIVLYTPDLSDEARKLDDMDDDEADALDGESPDDDGVVGGAEAGAPAAASGALGKAEGGQREPGEATQVAQGALSPTAAAPSPPPSPSISAGSPSAPQGQPPAQGATPGQGAEPSEEEVLQAVGQVLTQFKAQMPFFEQQVKQANPQAYQAVMGMVQGMVAMAQRLAGGSGEATPPAGAAGGGQPVKKSEGASRLCGRWVGDKSCTKFSDHPGEHDPEYRACKGCGQPPGKGNCKRIDGWECEHSEPKTREITKSEATKVELEPNRALPPMEELRKLYDSTMVKGEASPSGAHFKEFVRGFEHEAMEHPHLDANQAALTAKQHLAEDPQYYSKLGLLEETGVIGEESSPMAKAAMPASRHHVVLPPGSVGVGGRSRSVKVVEPVTGKTSWHQVSTGQKLSGDGHSLSTRVAECPSADSPEKRASDAGLVGAPTTAQDKPPQTAQLPGK